MTGGTDYLPVSEHGLIGDLHSMALVGTDGTIDWHCSPAFDAPAVFGSVAAPTASLPEQIGGERNWDYRYVWVRDAAFCVCALLRLGFTGEADAFMNFVLRHAMPTMVRPARCR